MHQFHPHRDQSRQITVADIDGLVRLLRVGS
jgi:hypothetical protein